MGSGFIESSRYDSGSVVAEGSVLEWDSTVVEVELSDELLEAFVLLDDSVFGSYTVKTMRVFLISMLD